MGIPCREREDLNKRERVMGGREGPRHGDTMQGKGGSQQKGKGKGGKGRP